MEGNNMVVEQPKKKSNALLVFLMFLIGIGIGFGANYGISYFNKNVDNKESSNVSEDTTKTEKLELTDATKAKMEMIVKSATECSSGSGNCSVTQEFFDNVTELTPKAKYTIVWNSILHLSNLSGLLDHKLPEYSNVETNITKEQYDAYKNNSSDFGGLPYISKSHFDNVYAQLFNEEAKYSIKDINSIGCPSPVAIDSSNDKLYYASECGGTGYAVSGKVTLYDSDANNYLVHSEITEMQVEKENTVHKILWKFDKDLNFVSTEKE